MDKAYPDFNIQAWGIQAAEITRKTIKNNALNGRVILLGWSMAGKVAQPFSARAKEVGLELDFYVSLAATPPIIGLVLMNTKIAMAPSGMADRSKDLPKWYSQIKSNESLNGNREIIPWSIFEKEYTGNIPVQLQGYGLRYKPGSCILPFGHPANAFWMVQNFGFKSGGDEFRLPEIGMKCFLWLNGANLQRLRTPRRRCFDAGLLS